MAKRKAGVNDIIYELDNDDIVVSSDDEVKEPKINRLETVNSTNLSKNETKSERTNAVVIDVDLESSEEINIPSPTLVQNGGKISEELTISDSQNSSLSQQNEDEVDCVKKTNTDCCKTTILNEDIVIDSPGNSDLGVEGCENRTPLLTVRFRDNRLASNYKEKIKAFMLNLIKLHEGDSVGSNNETDLELDIWPEDLNEERCDVAEENAESNLFFVDTDPGHNMTNDIPRYSQAATLISNTPEREPTPPPTRRGPSCFNCDGRHPLRDCPRPKDFAKIAIKRKSMPPRVGRYHVEDEQKFGHLIPGRISGQLRHALGLKRHELPLHIYRMRMLGYPPGWLEEARISHSGIAMFDSSGNATLEPEEEEGEVFSPGSKDKFDIKKILDFPGFNVPPSPRYKEEAHTLGLPAMSDQDSKLAMLQFLAPNAMKAYKRKKLTMFPSSASHNSTLMEQTEMDLDSGEEATEFPSVPPLPDEAPPLPPPPPPPLPSCLSPVPSPPKEEQKVDCIEVLKIGDIPVPPASVIVIDEDESEVEKSQSNDRDSPSLDDLEAKKQLLLNALDVTSESLPSHDITISDITETDEEKLNVTNDDNEGNEGTEVMKVTCDEEKENLDKQANVAAEVDSKDARVDEATDNDQIVDKPVDDIANVDKTGEENVTVDEIADKEELQTSEEQQQNEVIENDKPEISSDVTKIDIDAQESTSSSQMMDTQELGPSTDKIKDSQESSSSKILSDSQDSSDISRTPDSKAGHVKGTDYGTPVMNIASPFVKLPADEKFAKDICDVINFENLPNSTGKYKQISALLRKVKSEVDRIQES